MTRLFLDTNTKRQRFHGIEDSRDDCNGISCYIRITSCDNLPGRETYVHRGMLFTQCSCPHCV